MSLIGKAIKYTTHSGEVRRGIVEDIVFNESLNKEEYICISPYGHIFKLSIDELEFV